MKKIMALTLLLGLTACGGQSSHQDKQLAENAKQIELLKQQVEIQRLQNEVNAQAASAVQVYQLTASEVATTIPQTAQAAAKAGEVVKGTDGQQYTYDPDTGSWLLYGAIGAAAGYLAANAMNNRGVAKYQPVQKPTAATERVYQDYRAKNPTPPRAAAPYQSVSPRQAIAPVQKSATPAYRPTNKGYSNTRSFGFGRRRR